MRKIHKLSEYDGRFFSNVKSSWTTEELNPIELCKRLIPLLESQDPMDRRDADRVVYLLGKAIYCPDQVWVCKSVYAKDPKTGKRWSENQVIWSAHLTRENAEAWHAFWSKHWLEKGRDDYEMLPIVRHDRVPLSQLVHPDAKVGAGT